MNKEIKENLTGLMITLGTDTDINCATENGIIGYPIQYCPICGKKLK